LSGSEAVIRSFVREPLELFKGKWSKKTEYVFDVAKAKELLSKKVEDEDTAQQG